MFNPTLDIEAVAAFLARRLGEVEDLAPIGRGEWSSAFSFRTREGERVIRFGRFAEDYAKDRVAAGFARPGLPVPAVHELGEAFACAYAISERLHGVGFDTLDAAGYRRALPAVFRALDALRSVDVSASSGYGVWQSDASAPYTSWREALLDVGSDPPGSRTHGWRSKLATVPEAVERFEEGLRRLQAMVEVCPESRHVIHADLMGDNLLVQGDRVGAIVDWANAMYGDFVYDLARLTFWTPWFPELETVRLHDWVRDRYADEPDFEARLRCYQVHLGLDAQAYNAFTDRWLELERSGLRTLELGCH